MKKAVGNSEPEMRDKYDFSKGERGKYAKRYSEGSNIIILSPDVAEVFPDSDAVNEALRMLIKVANQSANPSS